MKVTIAPVKRVSITLFDKAQIIVEAYSAENTVRGTARKYKIQPKQIRQWKKKGLVEMFQGHRHRVTPLNATTDAVRANMMNDEDLEMDEAAEQTTTLLTRQQLMKKGSDFQRPIGWKVEVERNNLRLIWCDNYEDFLLNLEVTTFPWTWTFLYVKQNF